MEVFGCEVPVWLLLACGCLVLSYILLTWSFDTFKKMGIPYVKPVPVIGSLLSFGNKSLPEWDMAMMEKFPSGTYGIFQGCTPVVETFDIDMIKQITIKGFSSFTNRRPLLMTDKSAVLRYNLLLLRDEHWKHLRNTVTPTFSSGKLKQMIPIMADCTDRLVAYLKKAKDGPIVIKDYLSKFTMDVVAQTAFGLDLELYSDKVHPFVEHAGTFFGIPKKKTRWNKFKSDYMLFLIVIMPFWVYKTLQRWFGISFLSKESIEYYSTVSRQIVDGELSATSKAENNFVRMCVDKLVDPNLLSPEDVKRSEDGNLWSPKGLLKEEIMSLSTSFLVAGYETTATALQFFFYCMALHPDIQEKLYEEIVENCEDDKMTFELLNKLTYLDCCLHEVLRIYPPALRYDRVTGEDITINGIQFPKGMIVNGVIYSVHHNPNYWPEPEVFKPDRFLPENRTQDQQYIWQPFGLGNRNCIAMRLAMLELKVAIYQLMKELRFEKSQTTPAADEMKFFTGSGFLQPRDPLELNLIWRR